MPRNRETKKRGNSNKEKFGNSRPASGRDHSNGRFDETSDVNSDAGRMSLDRGSDAEDCASVVAESVLGAGGELTEDSISVIEEKLKENMENATNKNAHVRTIAVKNLENILSRYYLPDFLEAWKVTLGDCIERLMKKATVADGRSAAKLTALLALQLGAGSLDAVSRILTTLKSLLNDAALNGLFRAECASTLGVCTFIAEEEADNIVASLDSLRFCWHHFKLHSSPESVPLFCASLSAWTFILLQAPTKELEKSLKEDLIKVCLFLESPHLEVRVAAGECLALLYELGNNIYGGLKDGFRPSNHYHTLEQLDQLANESGKRVAKRDRRTQRASFRDIYSAVKENESPEIEVKFYSETLIIDSWSSKLCYDVFCHVFTSGINAHLKENQILRDVFDLGAPVPSGLEMKRLPKLQRQSIAQTISKARTLIRTKQRDKRMVNSYAA